jgi:dTDP-4-dehydrorhamnose reductase
MLEMTLVIIGKSGQLARALAKAAPQAVCLGREDVDLLSLASLTEVLTPHAPSAIINASAYTAVDNAESDYDNAYAINAIAVKNLAQTCKALDAHLVHVSTDYVFAGDKGSPYLPDDAINPINAYGKSKAQGEQVLQQDFAELSCILRTSWVYDASGKNFVNTMLSLMQTKPALTVVDDQIGSPTSATTLASACIQAAQKRLTGIHHCTDEGVASWYDFAYVIQQQALNKGLLSNAIAISPVSSSAFPTPAKRPNYSVMCKASLKAALPDIVLVHWQDALSKVLDEHL